MSKYIVLFDNSYTKEVVHPPVKDWITPPTKTEYYKSLGMNSFDTYQEAYDFSKKSNGFVVQTIEPRPIEPEEVSNA